MNDNTPLLVARKPLKTEFRNLNKIPITCNNFTVGRGLNNSMVVPFLAISRNHCIFTKVDDDWFVEDNSTFGISVNGTVVGKGKRKKLNHDDIILLEPSEEFVYQFKNESVACEDFEVPCKRIKLEKMHSEDIINDVKLKFEASQNYEIKHIEAKIQKTKHMQETSRVLKEQLQLDMDRKMKKLQSEFALQIENLKGEKQEVEKQKISLMAERDKQLATIQEDMEGRILELKNQIAEHNKIETELLKDNENLRNKLEQEREGFLAELSRESSSKQDMLDKLNIKLAEQEEIRKREKEELEQVLRKETERLILAKEKELRELEKQKNQREMELEEELNTIKVNLQLQVQEAEQERMRAQELLSAQVEEQRKLTDEEKVKREQLVLEREEIQKKLAEAQLTAEQSIEQLKSRVVERETELAALAAERIQKQADQSTQVITSLQEQLEKVKSQLESVESEKQNLLESIVEEGGAAAGRAGRAALAAVGAVLESELQCAVCAELFVAATTLACAHTFCKYCITMWKKKKKDCPICRTPITSECKSLVLDSFIDKMVQNLTEEMKIKRQDMLKAREAEVTAMTTPKPTASPSSARRGRRRRATNTIPTRTTAADTTPIATVDLTNLTMAITERPHMLSTPPAPFSYRIIQSGTAVIMVSERDTSRENTSTSRFATVSMVSSSAATSTSTATTVATSTTTAATSTSTVATSIATVSTSTATVATSTATVATNATPR